jgi:hypothetical protein
MIQIVIILNYLMMLYTFYYYYHLHLGDVLPSTFQMMPTFNKPFYLLDFIPQLSQIYLLRLILIVRTE